MLSIGEVIRYFYLNLFINYKLKCIILNGELKYTKSHIQTDLKSTNVYQSNITIEL